MFAFVAEWYVFMAHLVYQPRSLIQSCFVRSCRWHQHHCHLCTAPPATGLDIETSYLVYIFTYAPHICSSNILTCTVKPVIRDHPFCYEKVVSQDRWSLNRGLHLPCLPELAFCFLFDILIFDILIFAATWRGHVGYQSCYAKLDIDL